MLACAYCSEDLETGGVIAKDTRYAACRECLNFCAVDGLESNRVAKEILGVPALGEITPEGSVAEGVLKAAGSAIGDLPAYPEVPQKVIRLVHDPLTSMDDLARVINDDAGFSLCVLKVSNSAYMTPASEITDLGQACARLGLKQLNQMAYAFGNQQYYQRIAKQLRNEVRQLWLHGVMTAHCAEEIARACGVEEPESPYLAGLVHDVGKLVMLDAMFNRYTGRLGRLEEEPALLRKFLTTYSPWVGAQVVQHWDMPDAILCSTFFVNVPETLNESRWGPLTYTVALASDMAADMGYEFGIADPEQHAPETPTDIAKTAGEAGFDPEALESVRKSVAKNAKDYADAFDLS